MQRPWSRPARWVGPGWVTWATAVATSHVQVAKVLSMAQEMAERLTAEAKSEADTMLADARTKSEQLLSEARTKSDGLVNDARSRAETMLNDARTRAETLERQSRDKAATLVGDAERKQAEIIGTITRDKSVLEKKIDELRTFEREYRTRLKTYLESQLRDLGRPGIRRTVRQPGQLQRRLRVHRLRPARRRRQLTPRERSRRCGR